MKWAIHNGIRILSNPLTKDATCPLCNQLVIAKCGDIKIWHWAHKSNLECDSFGEGETEWHLEWKNQFPKENQEIIIEKNNNKHIADVKIKEIVIEFQNSSISPEQIKEREEFYDKMKWVLNGETFAKNLEMFSKKDYFSFKWKWFPKSWLFSTKPIYIDLNNLYEKYLNDYLKISHLNNNKTYSVISKYTIWKEGWDGESYPTTECFSYDRTFGEEKERLKDLFERYQNKLFLIKKLSNKGTGWGKLVSKDIFLKECQYGYYRN